MDVSQFCKLGILKTEVCTDLRVRRFNAFEGPPRILRFFGIGKSISVLSNVSPDLIHLPLRVS